MNGLLDRLDRVEVPIAWRYDIMNIREAQFMLSPPRGLASQQRGRPIVQRGIPELGVDKETEIRVRRRVIVVVVVVGGKYILIVCGCT